MIGTIVIAPKATVMVEQTKVGALRTRIQVPGIVRVILLAAIAPMGMLMRAAGRGTIEQIIAGVTRRIQALRDRAPSSSTSTETALS
ncbi:hypothetical protein [uncultured Roseobacter sp.]|uniref:hypothetical protein n=1 Tax=uncultured Roseobacter sp. TaxID=114847 RepID=UPI00262B906F|nr:hypothetical protein [uncultured Roseobacter sp.]